jgi:hypothetical protein
MFKKIFIILILSLFLVTSVSAGTIRWDFENGEDHLFNLWSVYPAVEWFDDPTIAGDEAITGVGGHTGLPENGLAWSIGRPDQYDGQKPAVDEGDKAKADGTMEYNQPSKNHPFTFPVNDRGQESYLNTYNLTQWGDNLHTQENDQIATSPTVKLGEGSVLTVWSQGGGSGTHAPEYDPDPAMMYTNGSSGIVILSAEPNDLYALLASKHLNGQGTLTEDTLDLSEFAGRGVFIEVVDAFAGSWGWLAIDEIQITNATVKNAALVVQMTDGVMDWGFDAALKERLEVVHGYAVRVVDGQNEISDDGFTIDDANAMDLLVISESIGSGNADPLIGTTTPMMHQEAYGWDNWSFMGERTNIHWEAGTDVDIVNDTHPIIVDANLSLGSMTFFDPQNSWTTELVSMMAPGAELLAKITVDFDGVPSDHAIVFAIEEGAELSDGNPSPNQVIGFSLPGLSTNDGGPFGADGLTEETWALFDASIRWLDPPPPTAAMIVSDVNLPNGFDQAQKDRLEMLGYDVTVATGDDVQTGVFTPVDAETFDVLIVSESIGSSSANNLIGANVPMMHQESYGWSRHFLTTGLQRAWTAINGVLDVVDDTHPIIVDAGLSAGPVQFLTDPNVELTTDLVDSLPPGAVNLAQVTDADGNDVTCIFAIEAGTELANASLAANRIVGFSLPGLDLLTADVMTGEAWALFDAAIAWLDPKE